MFKALNIPNITILRTFCKDELNIDTVRREYPVTGLVFGTKKNELGELVWDPDVSVKVRHGSSESKFWVNWKDAKILFEAITKPRGHHITCFSTEDKTKLREESVFENLKGRDLNIIYKLEDENGVAVSPETICLYNRINLNNDSTKESDYELQFSFADQYSNNDSTISDWIDCSSNGFVYVFAGIDANLNTNINKLKHYKDLPLSGCSEENRLIVAADKFLWKGAVKLERNISLNNIVIVNQQYIFSQLESMAQLFNFPVSYDDTGNLLKDLTLYYEVTGRSLVDTNNRWSPTRDQNKPANSNIYLDINLISNKSGLIEVKLENNLVNWNSNNGETTDYELYNKLSISCFNKSWGDYLQLPIILKYKVAGRTLKHPVGWIYNPNADQIVWSILIVYNQTNNNITEAYILMHCKNSFNNTSTLNNPTDVSIDIKYKGETIIHFPDDSMFIQPDTYGMVDIMNYVTITPNIAKEIWEKTGDCVDTSKDYDSYWDDITFESNLTRRLTWWGGTITTMYFDKPKVPNILITDMNDLTSLIPSQRPLKVTSPNNNLRILSSGGLRKI